MVDSGNGCITKVCRVIPRGDSLGRGGIPFVCSIRGGHVHLFASTPLGSKMNNVSGRNGPCVCTRGASNTNTKSTLTAPVHRTCLICGSSLVRLRPRLLGCNVAGSSYSMLSARCSGLLNAVVNIDTSNGAVVNYSNTAGATG